MFTAHSYEEALKYMGKKNVRPYGYGRATSVISAGDGYDTTIIVIYHLTAIAYYMPSALMISAGSYRTVTTFRRLNQILDNIDGGHIYRHNYEWIWEGGEWRTDTGNLYVGGSRKKFVNMMRFTYDGVLVDNDMLARMQGDSNQ